MPPQLLFLFPCQRRSQQQQWPPEQQQQIRIQIAGTLQGVVSQTLLPTLDGQGRVAAVEILVPDDAVRNLIRQGKVEQVYTVMQTQTRRGMQTMEQSLADLVRRNRISKELAISRSSKPEQLEQLIARGATAAAQGPGSPGLRGSE